MKIQSSKGKLLRILSKKKLLFKVPILDYYTYTQWIENKEDILFSIKKKYQNKLLALRSSAVDEDKNDNSNAGKYKSFLNVNCSNRILEKKINEIFSSYKKFRSIKSNDKFIVQEMVKNLSVSGVVFTKDLETQSDYYVVNYDDVSGRSDSVTSGKGELSNRSLYIKKNMANYLKSKRFQILIKAVQNLEKNLDNQSLDIEFILNKKFVPYLLQVRELKNLKNIKTLKENKIDNELKQISNKIKNLQKKNYKTFNGKKVFFGNMPDWNPAEIIGNQPKNLAFSLYNNLISKNIWVKARNNIGYKKNKFQNLIAIFGGRPYVNIKLSLNSFLPKGLPIKLYEKIVDFWQQKLKSEPHNHDKLEFNIAITCYDFAINKKLKTSLPKNLNTKEKNKFLKNLKKLTIQIISEKNNLASLSKQIIKIEKLEENFVKNKKLNNTFDIAKEIEKNLKICREDGLLPFSILARYAFISISLLNSLVEIKVIDENDKNLFIKNIDTITSEFLNDSRDLKNGLIDRKIYFNKYGHLRPGTYNLNSKKYENLNLKEFTNQSFEKTKSRFILSKKKILHINKTLKTNNFENIDSEKLFSFFTNSIKWREKGKFVYTKYISYILDLVEKYGKIYNIKKKDLVFLDIEKILRIEILYKVKRDRRTELLKLIYKNREKFKTNLRIKLPQLIFDNSAVYIVPHIVSSPNFVTKKDVIGKFVYLKEDESFGKKIENKIVIIENADPGFDWIFQKKIKGLITKYGGANSHMTIRCAELDVPAAIGVGEKKFNEIIKEKKQIELDCLTKNINLF